MPGARRGWAASAATALLLVCAPAPAHAAPLKVKGPAKIVSVDGPGLLTLKVGRRTLPVRLTGLDVPAANECGGTQTTEALRGFVARAPKPFAYALRHLGRGRYVRGTDGRFAAHVSYRVRRGARDLGSDLIRSGWARPWERASLDATVPTSAPLPEGTPVDSLRDQFDSGSPDGAQALCGGLLHLPTGTPVPASSPPTWTVDEHGVTQAIGSLTLSATLSPSETLTMRGLAARVPMEPAGWVFGTCTGYMPSLQLWAWSVEVQDQRCGDVMVGQLSSGGPGAATIARGGKVGDSVASLRRVFPQLDVDSGGYAAWLSGDPERQWAWQTLAEYEDGASDKIIGFATIQAPSRPDS